MKSIQQLLKDGVLLGDGGYLIELERRGYVDSGSRREKVGTGRGSGQFTPEVAIEQPEALRELHREFLGAGSQVLQALTFFGTREKLNRAGYGTETERINAAAVRLARDVAGDRALVAGSVSRTQLTEREGMASLDPSAEGRRSRFPVARNLLSSRRNEGRPEVRRRSRTAGDCHHEFPTADHPVYRWVHPRRMRPGHGR
jgi:hypothetical protein